ncbi:DUF802 domain-containing protein [Xenophilus arseniciresistens]|uniref:DUF802 domain-containing protein n=1 Tax=Xenophilus arseniciresistens TaxID=1283306 RepID=A0AAE3T076_9BURK|nr:DUF802 domain-containing protein [Xenophilus arseniciresistens]MDA7416631.1 DUF802 domain-containing protein [Xenophilus arseniciresistens]
MSRLPHLVIFIAGLLAVGWVGAGYLGQHLLALAMTLLIAAFYILGAWELWRWRGYTAGLRQALAALTAPPAALDDWLQQLPPALRSAVRRRVEGERAGLPGPTLTPYLVGLLVLLGMLGTFMGMVVTLQGTGSALATATDLGTIRQSLSAPVLGLGLAFGTSVAGVAASAMLGLMSALARRERAQVVQQLDAQAASFLRGFSPARQHESTLALLQQQAGAMPALVEQVQTLMQTLARQQELLNERLGQNQSRFHEEAQSAYRALASSVDQSLQKSLDHSARVAAESLQPVVQATLAGLAEQGGQLQQAMAQRLHEQLAGLSERLEATSGAVAQNWQSALAEHQRSSEALSLSLQQTHAQAAREQAERQAALIEQLQARLDASSAQHSAQWHEALAHQQRNGEAQSGQTQAALEAAAARFDAVAQQFGQQAGQLFEGVDARLQGSVAAVAQQWEQALAQHAHSSQAMGERTQAALEAASTRFDALTQRFEQDSAALVNGVGTRLEGAVAQVVGQWEQALAQQGEASTRLAEQTRSALQAAGEGFGQQGEQLLQRLQAAQTEAQASSAAQEAQRLAAWHESLAALRDGLQQQWTQLAEANAARQQQLCDTLAGTVREITTQHEAHARGTLEQIGQLTEAAAEAPRAAADVVAQLRQKLSESMVRDNDMLSERARILETLSTLLDAVNHASTEQRGAIDALVSTSAQLMERVGARFGEQVDAQAGHLHQAAAQLQTGTAEIASLGEAFGGALAHFGQGHEKLIGQLARIEEALDASLARSDEQLAYYVAQAREVIDLSVMSQKQIIEDLQQIASRQARAGQAGA